MKIKVRKSLCWFVIFGILLNVVFIFNVGLKPSFAETTDRYSATYGGDAPTPYEYTEISNETVNYTRREVVPVGLVNNAPLYTPISGLDNGCGAVAGAIIVGFYDKYYEELIPNYTTYLSFNGKYKGNDATYIPKLMRELYTLMRTNVDDIGVSRDDCLNGLKAYVQGKNRSLEYEDIKNSNKVDYNSFKRAMNENKPVLLFCDKTVVYDVISSSNSDRIVGAVITSTAHIVVGYELYEVKYYNGNNLFRTDRYIRIASGLSTVDLYLLKIDATDWCDGAYTVTVK